MLKVWWGIGGLDRRDFWIPLVQAKQYKDDGNKNFELKKYRWAIDSYTQGIKVRCADAKLNAVLYANRAACHVRLGKL